MSHERDRSQAALRERGFIGGLGKKEISRLDNTYGRGNWSVTGGAGLAQVSDSKAYKKGGGYERVPIYSTLTLVPKEEEQAPAADPEPVSRSTGPVDPPGRLDVGQSQQQQSSFDPMAMMMMPLLLEALRPKPIPQAPDPVVYGSAGQISQSTPGVKIKQSEAARSRSTQGTTGMFNRNNLRISNLNI
jgi:hypothetical protein